MSEDLKMREDLLRSIKEAEINARYLGSDEVVKILELASMMAEHGSKNEIKFDISISQSSSLVVH